MSLKAVATEIFRAGLESVLPSSLIRNNLKVKTGTLFIGNHSLQLDKNVYVVGFGKAVLGMGRAVEEVLQGHVQKGILSVPVNMHHSLLRSPFPEARNMVLLPDSKIVAKEGAKNNLPDENAMATALEIEKFVGALKKEDILIVLISGGGSALLPAPVKEISLADKVKTIELLASNGSTIQELNTVRKHLSTLKGGKFASIANCNSIIALILSDIIGDPLDLIASGPTVNDFSTFSDCLQIFEEYSLNSKVPRSVLEYLKSKEIAEGQFNSAALKMEQDFAKVHNVIIGNNMIAVQNCQMLAEKLGFPCLVLSTKLAGDVKVVAKSIAGILYWLIYDKKPLADFCFESDTVQQAYHMFQCANKICLLSAGETTVNVTGQGRGGRNQELVLHTASLFEQLKAKAGDSKSNCKDNFCFLSAGTDGQDGPTPAAGSFFTERFHEKMEKEGKRLDECLYNNASYDFLKELDNGSELFLTGLTGTNVMDIQILLVEKSLDSK